MRSEAGEKDYWRIECTIEDLRLRQQWESLKEALEEYSSVFDAGFEGRTNYHAAVRDMKAFYWLCSAEHNFYLAQDFSSTMDSLRRAVAFDVGSVSARLFTAKLLLHVCQPSLQAYYPQDAKLKVNAERFKIRNFHEEVKLELKLVLGAHYEKEFSESFRSVLDYVLGTLSRHERIAILSVLASFNTSDALAVCEAYRTVDLSIGKTSSTNSARKRLSFVLVTVRHFLSQISLDSLAEDFHHQRISLLRYTSLLDAVYARSVLNEILLDLEQCREDLQLIVRHVHAHELTTLPRVCVLQTLCAACRLPLIESKWPQWVSPAAASFAACIHAEGAFRRFLPISLVLALAVAAANMRVNAAYQLHAMQTDSPNRVGLDFAFDMFEHAHVCSRAALSALSHSDSTATCWSATLTQELLEAYRTLQGVYLELRDAEELLAEAASVQPALLDALRPLPQSLQHYLPVQVSQSKYTDTADAGDIHDDLFHFRVSADPLSLAAEMPRSLAGLLLAGIAHCLHTRCTIYLCVDDPLTVDKALRRTMRERDESSSHAGANAQSQANTEAEAGEDNAEEESEESVRAEVHSLMCWAFRLELRPCALTLYNLALASLGVQRVSRAIELLRQNHDTLLRRKRLQQTTRPAPLRLRVRRVSVCECEEDEEEFEKFRLDVVSRSESERSSVANTSEKSINGNTDADALDVPSVQHLLAGMSPLEQHSQVLLQWLGLRAQPIVFPWLPAAVLAEVSLRCALCEEEMPRCVQTLCEALSEFYDDHWAGEILSLVLDDASLLSERDRTSHAMVSSQFLSLDRRRPVVVEEGLERACVDVDLSSFQEKLRACALPPRLRRFLSLDVPPFVHNIASGLLLLLLQLAKCHAALSRLQRCIHSDGVRLLCEQERSFHRAVALRCLTLLFETIFARDAPTLCVSVQLETEVLLHFLIVLGECRGPGVDHALQRSLLRQLLRTTNSVTTEDDSGEDVLPCDRVERLRTQHPHWLSRVQPKLVHLLALNVTRQDAPSPKAFALAISLLESLVAQQIEQAREEIAFAHRCERKAQQRFSPAEHVIVDRYALDTTRRRTWNARYSIFLLLFHSGDYHQTLQLAEELVRDVRDFFLIQSAALTSTIEANDVRYFHCIFPCDEHSLFDRQSVVLSNSAACQMLLGVSRVCCALGKISLARLACSEAGAILYGVDNDVLHRLEQLSLKESITEHEAIDAFRHLPTLRGWKLFTATGMSARDDADIEADVLCECVRIIQAEEGCVEDAHHRVSSLLDIAISMAPQRARTQAALAELHLDRHRREAEKSLERNELSAPLTLALEFAKKALNTSMTNPDIWSLLSEIFEEMGLDYLAIESSITAAECRQNLPLRALHTVLW